MSRRWIELRDPSEREHVRQRVCELRTQGHTHQQIGDILREHEEVDIPRSTITHILQGRGSPRPEKSDMSREAAEPHEARSHDASKRPRLPAVKTPQQAADQSRAVFHVLGEKTRAEAERRIAEKLQIGDAILDFVRAEAKAANMPFEAFLRHCVDFRREWYDFVLDQFVQRLQWLGEGELR